MHCCTVTENWRRKKKCRLEWTLMHFYEVEMTMIIKLKYMSRILPDSNMMKLWTLSYRNSKISWYCCWTSMLAPGVTFRNQRKSSPNGLTLVTFSRVALNWSPNFCHAYDKNQRLSFTQSYWHKFTADTRTMQYPYIPPSWSLPTDVSCCV